MSTQMPLPTFLPPLGEQLHNLFPLNHASLVSVLGLALGYLKAMHSVKQPRAEVTATAHILGLFLNNPLVKAIIPVAPSTSNPSKELTAIQSKLIALEATVASLAKAGKTPLTPAQTTPSKQAQAPSAQRGPTVSPLTYTAKATIPPRPSVVVNATAYTWLDNTRPSPVELCATINRTLATSHTPQVSLSAAKWTLKGNLVIWGSPNTMVQQLTTSLPTISEALQASLSAFSSSAPSSPPQVWPNVKWSKLLLNGIPAGVTQEKEAYNPDECHCALIAENPTYSSLTITQKPSWVCSPSSLKQGATSSTTFSFEDPDSTITLALLHQKQLPIFGHVATLKRWKQKPTLPKHTSDTPRTNPTPLVVTPWHTGGRPANNQVQIDHFTAITARIAARVSPAPSTTGS